MDSIALGVPKYSCLGDVPVPVGLPGRRTYRLHLCDSLCVRARVRLLLPHDLLLLEPPLVKYFYAVVKG